MKATVEDLLPGDVVTSFFGSATFVARTDHPIWPGLQLVIWRMDDGSWSLDALSAQQEVGDVERGSRGARVVQLRKVLLNPEGSR